MIRCHRRRPSAPGPDPHQRNGQTARIGDLEAQRQTFRTAMNQHQRPASSKDAAPGSVGGTSPVLRARWPDAILQPPKPEITPSATILELATEHDIEPKAGG